MQSWQVPAIKHTTTYAGLQAESLSRFFSRSVIALAARGLAESWPRECGWHRLQWAFRFEWRTARHIGRTNA